MQTRAIAVFASLFFLLVSVTNALATSIKVIENPDGTKTTETMTHYVNTTPWDSAIVVLAIVVGLAVIWMGYRLITKGIPAAADAANAELEFNLKDKTVRAKNVTQGVLVVLLGTLVIIAALWWVGGGHKGPSSMESSPTVMAK